MFAYIAERLRGYSGNDREAAIEEFLIGLTFDLHMAITTDVEETELDFMERYGRGDTFYFRLKDYEHGRLLTAHMYWILLGERPDMSCHTGDRFAPGDKLFLFVHVSNLFPPLPADQA